MLRYVQMFFQYPFILSFGTVGHVSIQPIKNTSVSKKSRRSEIVQIQLSFRYELIKNSKEKLTYKT